MFSTSDTIVAVATPPGRGGIGVIRISGPDAATIATRLIGRDHPLTPRHATFARRADDHVVVTLFEAPHSYTGEHVVEIAAHGSPVVLNTLVRAAIDTGARLAEPGEFTLRAFLNNKMDLVQAEAVADLVDAVTPLQARAAFDQLEGTLTNVIGEIERELFDVIAKLEASLDFPDEGYHFVAPKEARTSLAAIIARIDALLAQAARGRLIREGAQVAIVGAPNVGKSSLFNALLNTDRAIVTAIPGTTRDLLTERADIGGLSLSLVDTAGVRETTDVVEQEGVARSRHTLLVADLVIVMLDRSRALTAEDRDVLSSTADQPRVVVWNKCDLPTTEPSGDIKAGISLPDSALEISATEGLGLGILIEAIATALNASEPLRDQPQITNTRHIVLLERARAAIDRAVIALQAEIPEEFPLIDLQDAAHALQEITGKRTTDELLHHIFARFCIGK